MQEHSETGRSSILSRHAAARSIIETRREWVRIGFRDGAASRIDHRPDLEAALVARRHALR
jgi:hypothetical protein